MPLLSTFRQILRIDVVLGEMVIQRRVSGIREGKVNVLKYFVDV
jgi:hypothetical protein